MIHIQRQICPPQYSTVSPENPLLSKQYNTKETFTAPQSCCVAEVCYKDRLCHIKHWGWVEVLTSLFGKPKRNSRSKRPGLRKAGSIESSLLVAPITTTSPLLSKPSISARSVDTTELREEYSFYSAVNFLQLHIIINAHSKKILSLTDKMLTRKRQVILNITK